MKREKRYYTFLGLSFSCVLLVWHARIGAQTQQEKIDTYIQSYVKTMDFSGCVLVAKHDSILFTQCYGNANYSFNVPNTMETKFKIGSISKQFTAAAILLLEEKGLLTTQDSLAKYYPDNGHLRNISIHHCLTHTSGLVDIYDLPNFSSFHCLNVGLSETTEMVLEHEPYFSPGERYQYSNGGYLVLADIIEKVSQTTYDAFLKSHIFEPLEIEHSGSCTKNEVVQGLAVGYDPVGYDGIIKAMDTDYLSIGAGSLYSTPLDLLLWIKSLRDRKLLGFESYDKFFKDNGHGYGYGISVYQSHDRSVFGHDGRITGYIADYLHYVDDDVTVIILGNIQTGVADFLRRDIGAIHFNKPYHSKAKVIPPASFNSEKFRHLPGVYSFGPNFHVTIDLIDGRMNAKANQGAYSEILLLTDGQFFNRTLYASIRFVKDENGAVKKMIWTNNDGREFEGVKLSDEKAQ